MTLHSWTTATDDELDAFVRAELSQLAANTPAPAVRVPASPRRRVRLRLPSPPPDRPRRLAPAAVALGLAVLVTAGSGTWVAVQRLHTRATTAAPPTQIPRPTTLPTAEPTAQPKETPRPAPAALVSTVRTKAPVFYYITYGGQPTGAVRLQAVDWSGNPQGHIDIPGDSLPAEGNTSLVYVQSPDGQRLLLGGAVYAADGTHLYDVSVGRGMYTWADDGRHICTLDTRRDSDVSGTRWSVLTIGPDGKVERTLPLPGALGDDAMYYVAACSTVNDRVAVYRQVSSSTLYVATLQISTGRLLMEHDLCPDQACTEAAFWTAATPDARLAAESHPGRAMRLRNLFTGTSWLLRERGSVITLSPDGSRLLAGPDMAGLADGNTSTPLVLIDVSTDTVLWSRQAGVVIRGDVAVQPGGHAMAVAWRPTTRSYSPGPDGKVPMPPPSRLTLLLPTGASVQARDLSTDVYALLGFAP
jgi:hypothetical protein